MKRLLAIFCVVILAQPAVAQTATEKAEKRLADLLAPGSGVAPSALATQPVQWKAGAVEQIVVPIKPYVGVPVRLQLPPIKDVKPRSVPEGAPLLSYRDPTQVPTQVELPTKPLVKLPALELHTPLALPILAHPLKDRASLGEPAFEASLDAAMKRFTALRERPVPFVAYNLPDPFENLLFGQLRNPPEEIATPLVIPVQRPK